MNEIFKYYDSIKDCAQQLVDEYNRLLTEEIKPYLRNKNSIIYSSDREKKDELKYVLKKIQEFYDRMSELEYRIDGFNDNTRVSDTGPDGKREKKTKDIKTFNDRIKVWLNLLQFRYLSPITIKLSEFAEIEAKKREKYIFVSSIIISALIGCGITRYFDKDNDLKNQTKEISRNQDSIINELRREYILNFDTLKLQNQQEHANDSVIAKKIDCINMKLKTKNIMPSLHN